LGIVVISESISEKWAPIYKDCIINIGSFELRGDYTENNKKKRLLQIIIFHQQICKKQRRMLITNFNLQLQLFITIPTATIIVILQDFTRDVPMSVSTTVLK